MPFPEDSYQVTLDCGDPRDLELHDGLLVPRAHYKQGPISLTFRVVGTRTDRASSTSWRLVAPPNLRDALGACWPDRFLIFQRIQDELEGRNFDHPYGFESYRFARLSVDVSQVPGGLSAKATAILRRLSPVLRHLPSKKAAPFLCVGLLATQTYRSESLMGLLGWGVSPVLGACGSIAFLRTVQEAHTHYQITAGLLSASARMGRRDFNYRKQVVKLFFRAYCFRYASSLGVATYLLAQGLK